MPEMQESQLGDHDRLVPSAHSWPPRLLEGSGGVVLRAGASDAAKARGGFRVWDVELAGERYRLWELKNFCWERIPMLRILQGATLQAAIGPRYIMVDGTTRPIYHPVPGFDVLYVAEPLFAVPTERMGELTVRIYEDLRPTLPLL